MLKKQTYIFVLILLFSLPAVSQITKGDEYYDKAQYIKAIPYYKKESRNKKSQRKQEALVKLGNSYRFINDYSNAEDAYRQALEGDGAVIPEVFYNYAQVLKTNAKYEEAAEQFANY